MAKDKEKIKEKSAGSGSLQQSDSKPELKWDSTDTRSAYANVFKVSGGREELVMLFGMNQGWDGEQQELKVRLTDKIVMSPSMARHFGRLLNNVIRDYERHYGGIMIESPQRG